MDFEVDDDYDFDDMDNSDPFSAAGSYSAPRKTLSPKYSNHDVTYQSKSSGIMKSQNKSSSMFASVGEEDAVYDFDFNQVQAKGKGHGKGGLYSSEPYKKENFDMPSSTVTKPLVSQSLNASTVAKASSSLDYAQSLLSRYSQPKNNTVNDKPRKPVMFDEDDISLSEEEDEEDLNNDSYNEDDSNQSFSFQKKKAPSLNDRLSSKKEISVKSSESDYDNASSMEDSYSMDEKIDNNVKKSIQKTSIDRPEDKIQATINTKAIDSSPQSDEESYAEESHSRVVDEDEEEYEEDYSDDDVVESERSKDVRRNDKDEISVTSSNSIEDEPYKPTITKFEDIDQEFERPKIMSFADLEVISDEEKSVDSPGTDISQSDEKGFNRSMSYDSDFDEKSNLSAASGKNSNIRESQPIEYAKSSHRNISTIVSKTNIPPSLSIEHNLEVSAKQTNITKPPAASSAVDRLPSALREDLNPSISAQVSAVHTEKIVKDNSSATQGTDRPAQTEYPILPPFNNGYDTTNPMPNPQPAPNNAAPPLNVNHPWPYPVPPYPYPNPPMYGYPQPPYPGYHAQPHPLMTPNYNMSSPPPPYGYPFPPQFAQPSYDPFMPNGHSQYMHPPGVSSRMPPYHSFSQRQGDVLRASSKSESVIIDLLAELKQSKEEASRANRRLAEVLEIVSKNKYLSQLVSSMTENIGPSSTMDQSTDSPKMKKGIPLNLSGRGQVSQAQESRRYQSVNNKQMSQSTDTLKENLMNRQADEVDDSIESDYSNDFENESKLSSPRNNSSVSHPTPIVKENGSMRDNTKAKETTLPRSQSSDGYHPEKAPDPRKCLDNPLDMDFNKPLLISQVLYRNQLESLKQRLERVNSSHSVIDPTHSGDKVDAHQRILAAEILSNSSHLSFDSTTLTLEEIKKQFELRRQRNVERFATLLQSIDPRIGDDKSRDVINLYLT